MKGDRLSDQDHIARYCAPKTLTDDGKPSGASFMLRPANEFRPADDFLSVNWMEYYGNIGSEAQLTAIRNHIQITPAARGLFAELNIGRTLNYVKNNDGKELSVLHDPLCGDPSHSGIYGYGHEDDMIADLIADVVQNIYPARQL